MRLPTDPTTIITVYKAMSSWRQGGTIRDWKRYEQVHYFWSASVGIDIRFHFHWKHSKCYGRKPISKVTLSTEMFGRSISEWQIETWQWRGLLLEDTPTGVYRVQYLPYCTSTMGKRLRTLHSDISLGGARQGCWRCWVLMCDVSMTNFWRNSHTKASQCNEKGETAKEVNESLSLWPHLGDGVSLTPPESLIVWVILFLEGFDSRAEFERLHHQGVTRGWETQWHFLLLHPVCNPFPLPQTSRDNDFTKVSVCVRVCTLQVSTKGSKIFFPNIQSHSADNARPKFQL